MWSKANWDAMKADTVTFCTEFLDPQSADKKLSGSGYPTISPLTIDVNGLAKLLTT